MPQFNNEKSNQVNSNSFGFVSRNYQTMTALSINYFNAMATIGIHLPDGNSKNDYPTFNYAEGIKAYLQPKDCKLIYKAGKKALKQLEETGEFKEFGLPLKRGLIQIAQAKDLKKKLKELKDDNMPANICKDSINPTDVCVVIYTELDDSKKTDKYLIHSFNVDTVITGYSPDTGKYNMEPDIIEFEYFLDALNDFAKAMTNGYTHSMKHDSRFDRKKWERMAFELATNLGVDLSKPSRPSKPGVNWGNSSSESNQSSRGSASSDSVQTIEVDSSDADIDTIISQMLH